jgi:hypothetical protein
LRPDLGSTIRIWPRLITEQTASDVADEALASKLFRRYPIQAGFEPRIHYLLHDDATDDFDDASQPGYKYSGIAMKSRPLGRFPGAATGGAGLADLCGVDSFNIGVDVVLYRA